MPQSLVILEKSDHIAKVTLNRPDTGNFVNLQMGQEMDNVCRQISQDDDIYVVIITGAGDVFCGGSELEKSFQSGKKKSRTDEEIETQYNVALCVAGIEKPVIAAINGDALGQGLALALACDIRIASQKAHFGFPNVALGLIPSDGGTQRLPRIIGKGKALELILTAEIIGAEEACEIGLVSRVVPPQSLNAEVDVLARAMTGKAPIALRYIKEAVNKGLDLTMEQGLRLEADLYFLLHTTGDRTEGIKAFQQKRTPEFKGQ
ncbi:MAG: enoyl-CoA hydratase-related protein [Dehalococcoidales bacterium]|nr:enoyl-CoA hydratase-related protein [Dehalococcoidales bacterium]